MSDPKGGGHRACEEAPPPFGAALFICHIFKNVRKNPPAEQAQRLILIL